VQSNLCKRTNEIDVRTTPRNDRTYYYYCYCSYYCYFWMDRSNNVLSVADLEGTAPSAPLGRRTDAVIHFYISYNAKYWSFYCKTWYSEYSEWLPPVAFWQLRSAQNSFLAGALSRTPLGKLTASAPTDPLAPLRVSAFKGTGGRRRGKGEGKGRGGIDPLTQISGSVPGFIVLSWVF